jgi:hypothetical protein
MRAFAQKQNKAQPPAFLQLTRLRNATRQASRDDLSNPPTLRVGHDFSQIPVRAQSPLKVQSKLANPLEMLYEPASQSVTEQVLWMPDPPQTVREQPRAGNETGEQLPRDQKQPLGISSPLDVAEKEADEVARRVVNGAPAQVNITQQRPEIMRQVEKGNVKVSAPNIANWECHNQKGAAISPDNNCDSCEGVVLGVNCPDQFMLSNGIELKAHINNHTEGHTYDIKRIRNIKYWEKLAAEGSPAEWVQTRTKKADSGTKSDDEVDSDEYLLPQEDVEGSGVYHIYSKDRPGLNKQQPQTRRDSREVVMLANFTESVAISNPKHKSHIDPNTFAWHSKLWVAWDPDLGGWKVIEERSSIGPGHISQDAPAQGK